MGLIIAAIFVWTLYGLAEFAFRVSGALDGPYWHSKRSRVLAIVAVSLLPVALILTGVALISLLLRVS